MRTKKGGVLRPLPYVAAIAVAVAAFAEMSAVRRVIPADRADGPAEPAWPDQLPAHFGRNLILLQAKDHHVRAVTEHCETSIRTGMEEATKALGGFDMRIRRSRWVTRGAVDACRRRMDAPVVVLLS